MSMVPIKGVGEGRGLSERVLVKKSEDGMAGDRDSLSLVLEPREAIVRASESSDTNAGLPKKRGNVSVKPCCNTPSVRLGHGPFGREPLMRSYWSVLGIDSDSDSDSEVFLEGWPLGKFKVRQKPKVDCLENSPGRFPI